MAEEKNSKKAVTVGKMVPIIITASLVGVVVFMVISAMKPHDPSPLAEQVYNSLKSSGDTKALASESAGGLQGDITKVENGSDGEVKVSISTDFSSPDQGKEIAKTMMGAVCLDNPELDSLYVINANSGLESGSAYRSDIPACRK